MDVEEDDELYDFTIKHIGIVIVIIGDHDITETYPFCPNKR